MAKRKGRVQAEIPSDNEIDEFHSNRELILFNQAGQYSKDTQESEPEDDEVLGLDEGDEESEDGEEEESEDEEDGEDGDEEDEEGWGGRKDYYGGDEAGDMEDAKRMTEEAIRQQKKNLKELGVDDYLDDDMMEDWSKQAESFDSKSSKITVTDASTDFEKLDQSEKLELLSDTFPEFVPLLKELQTLQPLISSFEKDPNEVNGIKKIALSSYLGAVSSYFSIFVDQLKSGDFASMKEHPVMETILTTRQIWKDAEKLQDIESEDEFTDAQEPVDISEDISEEDVSDISASSDEQEQEEDEESEEDIDVTSKRTIKELKHRNGDDFMEADEIEDVDDEDKQSRKKSLRFYTSKIDQSQAKNNEKFQGDLDIPYKERLFERKQRLIEEARKRGQSKDLGDDLDDEDYNSDDQREIPQGDEYYESMKAQKQHKKEARKSAHAEAVKLAKEGKLAEGQELLGQDGKRALNFQILKNKGLTAKKRKEVRNSRVKKRNKYDQAKKKLKSVRQVHTENSGPYEGEKTGIKKGLSRSVKLG